MTEEEIRSQAFEAIVVDGDITPLLIYADRLEEEGYLELAMMYRLMADPDNERYIEDFDRLTGGSLKTFRQLQKQLGWIDQVPKLEEIKFWSKEFGGFPPGDICKNFSLQRL